MNKAGASPLPRPKVRVGLPPACWRLVRLHCKPTCLLSQQLAAGNQSSRVPLLLPPLPQAVMSASGKRFIIDQQSDPVDFLSWLVNTLHHDLTGGKRKKRSGAPLGGGH